MPKQFIEAWPLTQFIDLRIRIVEVAEADGTRRTRGLARGDDLAVAYLPLFLFGGAPRPADALDAIGAFLHHAACAHGDIRIEDGSHHFGAEIGVFLSVGVAEEIEAPHLVGTIRLAEPGSDAAIVDLGVQSLAVVD